MVQVIVQNLINLKRIDQMVHHALINKLNRTTQFYQHLQTPDKSHQEKKNKNKRKTSHDRHTKQKQNNNKKNLTLADNSSINRTCNCLTFSFTSELPNISPYPANNTIYLVHYQMTYKVSHEQ